MKVVFVFGICMFIALCSRAQVGKTVLTASDSIPIDTTKYSYKGLVTKSFYAVSAEVDYSRGRAVYKANGKGVTKEAYDKYTSAWDNMVTCRPCILMSYDENEKLIRKSIQYTDCPVGFWIEYYPSRRVRVIGHYKESTKGGISGMCDPPAKDGSWTYYGERGGVEKIEIYRDGVLVN